MTALPDGGRVLVTGATGFVGRTLTGLLADRGYEVLGMGSAPLEQSAGMEHLSSYRSSDLADEIVPFTDVHAVVHLAGLAQVGRSFDEPQRYISSNSAMFTNLCEPLLAAVSAARIIVVSSGAVYSGSTAAPIDEGSPIAFSSPYAVSKVLVENQAAYYRARGLDTVVARPLNHIGPGQSRGYIVPDLAARLADREAGVPMRVGNLDARRDYTDVRDVAEAYLKLLVAEPLQHDTYNVASGTARSGWEVLDVLADAMGIPSPEVDMVRDRAIDPSSVVGDASRLRNETGWAPRRPFEESIRDFLRSS
ncbi:NAD-dependent epimerase/dehydratase family protein [Naasia lichenicola]|uniref:NAD-dependent epimerase/dehydratase family protein n=1 Tax=Naasia lichenicola TaxID=2565933 RepID=UPI00130E43BC|nr:NAD-dependent epimerase/dehydratase family protein [Naasia lichenicola]